MAKRRRRSSGKVAHRKTDRLAWWRQARFGMFIHWGLYSVAGRVLEGPAHPAPGRVDHAPRPDSPGRIRPARQALQPRRSSTRSSGSRWPSRPGMKYLVITAKHHDGFAMYHSPCSRLRHRRRHALRPRPHGGARPRVPQGRPQLCFYYSQYQDWADPNGGASAEGLGEPARTSRSTSATSASRRSASCSPQYGPIGLIWFDTPGDDEPRAVAGAQGHSSTASSRGAWSAGAWATTWATTAAWATTRSPAARSRATGRPRPPSTTPGASSGRTTTGSPPARCCTCWWTWPARA